MGKEPESGFDLELPEIPDGDPYSPPDKHLVKSGADAWKVEEGRRASKILLPPGIREAVDTWRAAAEPMLDRIKRVPNLMVLNDEANHVHDEDLAWSKTLMSLHEHLKTKGNGLTAWLDFSATPKNQNGTYFPWGVVDYPLAQAVEDRIVKPPLTIHQTDKADPDKYAHEEAGEAYNEWIAIAVEAWPDRLDSARERGRSRSFFMRSLA